ncbi:unnamed protein product [Dovyalis caffra]|uniref:Peptidase metallopeptidase domain-containing protein n=1 Tax=Dovyalis caffra TaxID=77055 RepID=A0AAV1QX10_9ROSI|nr:unnamed protein product [Dovyalis caffra]
MAVKTFQFLVSLFLLLVILINFVQPEPTGHPFKSIQNLVGSQKGQSVSRLHLVKQYLKKFGYLNYDLSSNKVPNQANNDVFDDLLESAIRTYQQKFHLEVTGKLDNHTVNQMTKPRCGVPDIFSDTKHYNSSNSSDGVATADYSFFPGAPKWSKKILKYKIGATVQVAGSENFKSVCIQSFQKWAEVTDFLFKEVTSSADADIEIAFKRLDHGDNHPFDGPRGIYAHGFRPPIGILHFDADETWSSNPGPLELDLESVAVHEIGHLLGLGHSEDHPESIMYPYFDYGKKKRNLQEDDIEGIQDLYGLD